MRTKRLWTRGTALGLLLMAGLALAAQTAPQITFEEQAVTASGLTPGGSAVFFGVEHRVEADYSRELVRRYDVSTVAADGTARFEPPQPVTPASVWVAVDQKTGRYAVAAPEGYRIAHPAAPPRLGAGPGALTLSIPLGTSYPVGGGFSYSLKLVYNSTPWMFERVTYQVPPDDHEVTRTIADPSPCSNAGLGWRVSLGRLNPPCQVAEAVPPPEAIYQDENGTDHIFYPTLHAGDPEDAPVAGVNKKVTYEASAYYILHAWNCLRASTTRAGSQCAGNLAR